MMPLSLILVTKHEGENEAGPTTVAWNLGSV
jgi:hypothetical protein